MKIAIVGSRKFPRPELVRQCVRRLAEKHPGFILISGGAQGVDTWAADEASALGIEVIVFPADWDRYGRAAGMLRNTDIVKEADAVIAFHDGVSKGTKDTMNKARAHGKKLRVVECR